MNHKFNESNRCEKCGILKSTANAGQICVGKDDNLVSAETMATFASLFEPVHGDGGTEF